MANVYMTVTGRSEDTTEAIASSDALLGVESSHDWLSGYTPAFIDYPFTDPSATFDEHLATVMDVSPRLTVAPDVENGRELSDVIRKADELLNHADSVIVVPKSVNPSRVPDRFRVGIPLADYGSGAPWCAWDYRECAELHLLGGGPARQLQASECLRNVESLDTATLGKRCRFGMWDGGSCDAPDGWDYRKRLKESLDNYAATWSAQR